MIRIIYFGTPQFAVQPLEWLVENQARLDIRITGVVTPPDKPIGRKQVRTATPVKLAARRYNIPVFHHPLEISDVDCDLALLYSYGKIIAPRVLSIPKYGFWNIHPSMLPFYRGASPTVYPILLGDSVTGVSLMQMDDELDHGPVIAQKQISLSNSITRIELEKTLTEISTKLVESALLKLSSGLQVSSTIQMHTHATFTRKIVRKDGYVDPVLISAALKGDTVTYETLPEIIRLYNNTCKDLHLLDYSAATILDRMMRAFVLWPGVWTNLKLGNKLERVKLLTYTFSPNNDAGIELDLVQREGKNPILFSNLMSSFPNAL